MVFGGNLMLIGPIGSYIIRCGSLQPEVVTMSLRISQSRPIYEAFVKIKDNEALWSSLSPAQQRIVECECT